MNKDLTIVERFDAPTPKFFKKLQQAALLLGTIAATLAGFNDQLAAVGLTVPDLLVKISTYVSVGSLVAAFVAQLTVDWEALKKKTALDSLG